MMYGDLVNGLCYTIFLPVYLGMAWTELRQQQQVIVEESSTTATSLSLSFFLNTPQVQICLAFAWTTYFCWISWLKNSPRAAVASYSGMVLSIVGMNLYQWPHQGEVIVFPQFIWCNLILAANRNRLCDPYYKTTSNNNKQEEEEEEQLQEQQQQTTTTTSPLSKQQLRAIGVRYSIFMLFEAVAGALSVAIFSPDTALTETAPMVLGLSSVHLFILIRFATTNKTNANQKDDKFFSAPMASVILTGTLAFHFFSEISNMIDDPTYLVKGGYSIIRAGFFAAIGLMASGAFQTEVDINVDLQAIVEQRAREIVKQAERLRIVGMALEASETAIAIINTTSTTSPFSPTQQTQQQRIVWTNTALQRLMTITPAQQEKLQRQSEQMHPDGADVSLTQVLQMSLGDKTMLQQCFNPNNSTEEEILVYRRPNMNQEQAEPIILQVIISPSVDWDQKHSTHTTKNHKSQMHQQPTECQFVVAFKDITEKRARERAEAAAKHEAMMAQAMNESMTTLSHELRTPLQGIMGMTSMLLDTNSGLNKYATDSLTLIMISSRLLLTLINNMLDIRKCDANMMSEFKLTSVPLKPSIHDAIDFCRPLATVSNVGLDVVFEDSTLNTNVRSDSLRIQQVVINLVSNAIKYTPMGSSVHVKSEIKTLEQVEQAIAEALASGSYPPGHEARFMARDKSKIKVAVISVSDEGHGIDEDQHGRIFKKFSQLNDIDPYESSKNHDPKGLVVGQPTGTGLGLNLCEQFVRRMQGNIWVKNQESSRGSRFSFFLPLAAESKMTSNANNGNLPNLLLPLKTMNQSPTTIPNPPSPNGVQSFASSTVADLCRVLVVDDTLINLKVLDRMLNQLGVKTIKCVDSGAKALVELEKSEYDLVITDVQMPDMSGIELSEAITQKQLDKNSAVSANLIVVGLTAETNTDVDEQCAAAGMVLVLRKPITAVQMRGFFEETVGPLLIATKSSNSLQLPLTSRTDVAIEDSNSNNLYIEPQFTRRRV